MRELRGQRPRGIGDVEATGHVDGDDMTWDWWQALGEAGDLSHADVEIFGTLFEGEVRGVVGGTQYDTRTCAERHNWHTGLLLQRIQQLERRLASVEAKQDQCWGGL